MHLYVEMDVSWKHKLRIYLYINKKNKKKKTEIYMKMYTWKLENMKVTYNNMHRTHPHS